MRIVDSNLFLNTLNNFFMSLLILDLKNLFGYLKFILNHFAYFKNNQ